MKTLYESILSNWNKTNESIISNTNIGVYKKAMDILLSDKSICNYNRLKPGAIKVEPGKNGIIIILNNVDNESYWKPASPFIYDQYFLDAKLPKIEKVTDKYGHIHPILFNRCNFFNTDITDIIVETPIIKFIGCALDTIDKLPKGCEELEFSYAHSLASGNSNNINNIKNIKLKRFTSSITKNGLSCPIDNIKNITVTNKCDITHGMIGWDVLKRGGKTRTFDDFAQDKLKEFFKDNKINMNNVSFIDCMEQTKYYVGEIKLNKAGLYTFIGYNV